MSNVTANDWNAMRKKREEQQETIRELVALLNEMDIYLDIGNGTSIYHDSIFHRNIKTLSQKHKDK